MESDWNGIAALKSAVRDGRVIVARTADGSIAGWSLPRVPLTALLDWYSTATAAGYSVGGSCRERKETPHE